MEKITINTAIMFADVAGNSKLYKQVGDAQAISDLSSCPSYAYLLIPTTVVPTNPTA